MSRRSEFDDSLTLYHKTDAPAASLREKGLSLEHANPHDPVIWGTTRKIGRDMAARHKKGWPEQSTLVTFRVPRADAELAAGHHERLGNYTLKRSVRPEEILHIKEFGR